MVDGIIREPLGGAHSDREGTFKIVKKTVLEELKVLAAMPKEEMIAERIAKYEKMGVYKE